MPTSVATLPIGTNTPPNSNTALGVNLYYNYENTVEYFSGASVANANQWGTADEMYVKQGSGWQRVQSAHALSNGSWTSSGTNLMRTRTRRTTRARIWSLLRYGEPDGRSIYTFSLPDDLYIPTSWKLVQYHSSGLYDDVCDGTFFGQGVTIDSVRDAVIMAKRPSSNYVGSNTDTWESWQSWSGTVTNLPQSQSGNRTRVQVRTQNTTPRACGAERCIDISIPPTFVAPFNINQWVSVKAGGDCSVCNHGAELVTAVFEDPTSEVITYS